MLEKYDRQAEQQRQIRDEERNSIEDRIAANNKLGEVLEEQNTVMLKKRKHLFKKQHRLPLTKTNQQTSTLL